MIRRVTIDFRIDPSSSRTANVYVVSTRNLSEITECIHNVRNWTVSVCDVHEDK